MYRFDFYKHNFKLLIVFPLNKDMPNVHLREIECWSRLNSKKLCLCIVSIVLTSMASLSDPASRKKAADCSKRCFPSREKAFFKAAFRQRSSLKLFLKN